jgi:hypothetical protein
MLDGGAAIVQGKDKSYTFSGLFHRQMARHQTLGSASPSTTGDVTLRQGRAQWQAGHPD